MNWIDLFWMSSGNLRRRKLRTFLTVLGVVIGTISVVTMLSLGLGMQNAMYQDIENYGGLTTLKVTGSESFGDSRYMIVGSGMGSDSDAIGNEVKYVTDARISELEKVEHVKSVAGVYQINVTLLKGKYEAWGQLTGMTKEALADEKLDLEWGELPAENTGVFELIIGSTIPADFYNSSTGQIPYYDKGELAVDFEKDSIFMITDMEAYQNSTMPDLDNSGLDYGSIDELSGALDEPQAVPAKAKKYSIKAKGLLAGGPDRWGMNSMNIYCDLDTMIKILKKEYNGRPLPGQPVTSSGKAMKEFAYSFAQVKVDDLNNAEALSMSLREMGYNVESQAEWMEQVKSQMVIVQAVLGGIGAISLLVAAIGIANTMMMAIYERTREIGVMKVIGCRLKNIRQLFLIEAASIGLIGGILGVVLSFGVSALVNMATAGMMGYEDMNISYIPFWLIFVALGIATFVGIASGYFPALRAMRLSPLAAIRNE